MCVCFFTLVASLPIYTSLTMEILLFPAVLLLCLSDSQLITYFHVCVWVRNKERNISVGLQATIGLLEWLWSVLLLWASLPENIVCVCACVHLSYVFLWRRVCVCVCHARDIKASSLIQHLLACFTPLCSLSFKGKLSRLCCGCLSFSLYNSPSFSCYSFQFIFEGKLKCLFAPILKCVSTCTTEFNNKSNK